MQNPLIQKNPLLSGNVLTTRDSGGNESYYNFVVDLIASNRSINEVQSFPGFHEVIHRATSNYRGLTNSFLLLRKLAGLSHALIMHLIIFLDKNNLRLKGNCLSNLTLLNGSFELNTEFSSIIQRISYLESIYDMGWKAIIPIAELIAIDFSNDIRPHDYFYFGWDIDRYYQLMSMNNDIQKKLDQIKKAIKDFPENFGGYDVKYGSFSKAMEKTFLVYNKIDDDAVRFPILDTALHVLYLDETEQVVVNDPLEMIMKICSDPLLSNREEFLNKLAYLRVAYGNAGQKLIVKMAKDLMFDIPEDIINHRDLPLAISYLMLEQKQGNINYLHYSQFVKWVETLSRSFLRMDFIKQGSSQIEINPNFLLAALYRIGKINNQETPFKPTQAEKKILEDPKILNIWKQLNLQSDWWKRLILLESIRSSLKKGERFVCPFFGLEIKDISDIENEIIRCNDNCFIRAWLIKLAGNSDIVNGNSFCNI